MTTPGSCASCTRHLEGEDGGCTVRCRHVPATVGVLCAGCAQQVRADLDMIRQARVQLLHEIGSSTAPSSGSERPVPGGVDRLDFLFGPELLAFLDESIRAWADPDVVVPNQVAWQLSWLRRDLERRGFHTVLVVPFAATLHKWATRGALLAGLDEDAGAHVACPTITVDGGECRRRLRIDVHRPEEAVECYGCGRSWTTGRLLDMAERSSADVFLDVEACAVAVKVPERTLRHWAAAGRVRRSHSRYHLGDARAAAESATRRAGEPA